jgi:hypothetical protein
MVEKSLYYAGITFDFPNYFPSLSFFHRMFGIEKKMKDFIQFHRDPLMLKLINEAKVMTDYPNGIRSIKEDHGVLEDEQKIVILSNDSKERIYGCKILILNFCWMMLLMLLLILYSMQFVGHLPYYATFYRAMFNSLLSLLVFSQDAPLSLTWTKMET